MGIIVNTVKDIPLNSLTPNKGYSNHQLIGMNHFGSINNIEHNILPSFDMSSNECLLIRDYFELKQGIA